MLSFVEFVNLISLVVDIQIWEQETKRVIYKLNDMYFMPIKINEINNQNNMLMLTLFTRLLSLSFFMVRIVRNCLTIRVDFMFHRFCIIRE